MNKQAFKCEMTIGDAVGQILVWVLLLIVTLGLAAFVMPYYILKAPINRTYVVDAQGNKTGKLTVEVAFGDVLGHALIWVLLTIVTFGIAYIVYFFAVVRRLLNMTTVEPIGATAVATSIPAAAPAV